MKQKIRTLPFLSRFYHSSCCVTAPALHANMRRVLVIKPGGNVFQEAVFVLRDDYFPSGISRQELIRQAYSAAESCLDEYDIPKAQSVFPYPLTAFLSGCACTLLALRLFGLL